MLYLIWTWIVDIFRLFTFIYIFGVPVPAILIYFLLLMSLYFAGIFWPFLLRFVIVYLTPFLNILIEIFNVIFAIQIIILRVLIQIWNMFVPFIGMILYVVVDLVTTIMGIVFDVLGAIDFEGIIQSIMEIIFFLVDVVLKIVMVLVQVQMTQLQILVEVITPIMEIIMDFVKILFPILAWVLQFLFRILEPILQLVAAIAEIFAWMVSSSSATAYSARSLLEISGGSSTYASAGSNTAYRTTAGEYNVFRENQLHPKSQSSEAQFHFEDGGGDYWDARSMYNWYKSQQQAQHGETSKLQLSDDYRTFIASVQDTNTTRNSRTSDSTHPTRKRHLMAVDEADLFGSSRRGAQQSSRAFSQDDVDRTVAQTLYSGYANNIKANHYDLRTMREMMDEVLSYETSKRDRLSTKAIYDRYRSRNPQHFAHSPGPANVAFRKPPEHPSQLHEKLKQQRNTYSQSIKANSAKQRKPLAVDGNTWDSASKTNPRDHKLAKMEKEHARMLIEQENKYVVYHENHARASHLIFNSLSEGILKHGKTTLSYDTFAFHWNNILARNGYHSLWDVYHEFVETHGDAAQFMANLNWVRNNTREGLAGIIASGSWFGAESVDHGHSSPKSHFTSWSDVKKAVRRHYRHTTRSLLQQDNSDRDVSSDEESKEGSSTFEMVAKRDCFSEPRNPLCLPEIPESFSFEIPKIVWPSNLTEATDCSPWRNTGCLYCLDRLHNGFQSLRFFLSGFLIPLNFLLTTFTLAVPWLSWTVDWVFLVPKGEIASLFDFVCYFQHLYDFALFLLTIAFFFKFVLPVIHIFIVKPLLRCRTILTTRKQLGSDEEYNEQLRQKVDNAMVKIRQYARQRAYFGKDWRTPLIKRPDFEKYHEQPRENISTRISTKEEHKRHRSERLHDEMGNDERVVNEIIRSLATLKSLETESELYKVKILALVHNMDSTAYRFLPKEQRDRIILTCNNAIGVSKKQYAPLTTISTSSPSSNESQSNSLPGSSTTKYSDYDD
jgi:hypothetical protein